MLNHKGTRDIRTERLLLRRFRPDDNEAMFRNWASDREVTVYTAWNPHESPAKSLEVIEKWIAEYESESTYHWAIERDGELIGDLNTFSVSDKHNSCEVGYAMSRALWGKGYTTEAVRGALRYLFTDVGMHRVAARHDVRNIASGRVMQKAGMLKEGMFRKAQMNKYDEYYDLDYYAILKEDWEAANKPV